MEMNKNIAILYAVTWPLNLRAKRFNENIVKPIASRE